MVVPVSGIRHAIAIDFDPVDKFLYWSDDEKLEIKRCRMNGQSKLEVTLHVIFMVILFQAALTLPGVSTLRMLLENIVCDVLHLHCIYMPKDPTRFDQSNAGNVSGRI